MIVLPQMKKNVHSHEKNNMFAKLIEHFDHTIINQGQGAD